MPLNLVHIVEKGIGKQERRSKVCETEINENSRNSITKTFRANAPGTNRRTTKARKNMPSRPAMAYVLLSMPVLA
jgi:hypothetical protein